jgi:hypothetical protein
MMRQARILIRKVVSPDGKSFSEARSIAIVSGSDNTECAIEQSITVGTSSNHNSNSCSSSSYTYSRSTSNTR